MLQAHETKNGDFAPTTTFEGALAVADVAPNDSIKTKPNSKHILHLMINARCVD